MDKSETVMTAMQNWLRFAAFTLSGVAFEGARYGNVIVPQDDHEPEHPAD
ncbi:hypothetical protein [Pantoea ananatis]|nr:hypothetical protein [Pantoea ananatis]MCW0310652.1 hypothetical protein [Pantoea ananatis]MCW0329544.1 hypothetical protein [Pantoea ananatis]MCW0346863.1 hypothetical protein [Pantoea ananatis]MCW0351459.1 hypothetical protein [Pantoea ananatis]QZE30575.1 hypothetical protein K4732_07415 [Pantoea ananatis]